MYESIIAKARQNGLKAVSETIVQPMYVTDGKTTYRVDDGLCGFASIHFMGNTSFGRWAKANGIAKKGGSKGLYIWVGEFNQSYEKKKTYAEAFVKTLRENGINAWSESNLD